MKSIVWLIALCCCLAVGETLAAPRPIPDAGPTEVPDRTPQSDAVFDTLFAAMGLRVTDVVFVNGFAPGASRDVTASQLSRIRPGGYLVGAVDLERFDGRRNTRNQSQMNNVSLGLARAVFVNAKTGYRSTVLPQVILNDRRGVYQVFTEPIVKPQPPFLATRRDTIVIQHRIVEQQQSGILPDWGRVGVGWTGVLCEQVEAGLPFGTLSAGWNLSERVSLGGYAAGGLNLGSPNDRTAHAGAELLLNRFFIRLGYRTAAVEIPGDGHTLARYEGLELGTGFRNRWLELGIYGSGGKYADVDDRRWRDETLVSLELSLGHSTR